MVSVEVAKEEVPHMWLLLLEVSCQGLGGRGRSGGQIDVCRQDKQKMHTS